MVLPGEVLNQRFSATVKLCRCAILKKKAGLNFSTLRKCWYLLHDGHTNFLSFCWMNIEKDKIIRVFPVCCLPKTSGCSPCELETECYLWLFHQEKDIAATELWESSIPVPPRVSISHPGWGVSISLLLGGEHLPPAWGSSAAAARGAASLMPLFALF